MITDIYEPIDEPSKLGLEIAQRTMESPTLLAGLGENCQQYPVLSSFPIITDLDRSEYLLRSQEMWDEPEDTRKDQFFAEIQGAAVQGYPRYDGEESRRRRQSLRNKLGNCINISTLYLTR